MTTCIHPYCGREIGSKSDDHEPDTCGKTSCNIYSQGMRFQRRLSAVELLDALSLPAAEQDMLRQLIRDQVRGDDRGIDVGGLVRELRARSQAHEGP